MAGTGNSLFLGDTALVLMQADKSKRLSIDIDIIMPKPYDKLLSQLEEVVQ